MNERGASAAIAAEMLTAAGAGDELLRSIVAVAKAIFVAQAASIALLDLQAGDFVFKAAVGAGADGLTGNRFSAGQGIAGVVAQSGEPIVIDDLSGDPRFARDVATSTGYVPNAIMVAPLLRDERVLGVLSVLDRGQSGRSTLQELELLTHFANQAALAVDLDAAARQATVTLKQDPDAATPLGTLAGRLDALDPSKKRAADQLILALVALLDN